MQRYKRYIENTQKSYLTNLKMQIQDIMKQNAIKQGVHNWNFIFGKTVTLDQSVLTWTQTFEYKQMTRIIEGFNKKENLSKLLSYANDYDYKGLKTVAETIMFYEHLMKARLSKRMNLYRVQSNPYKLTNKPQSFTKINLLDKSKKAGTFYWGKDDYLIIIEQAIKGFDLSGYIGRDPSEKEVVVIGKYKVTKILDHIVYLKEV